MGFGYHVSLISSFHILNFSLVFMTWTFFKRTSQLFFYLRFPIIYLFQFKEYYYLDIHLHCRSLRFIYLIFIYLTVVYLTLHSIFYHSSKQTQMWKKIIWLSSGRCILNTWVCDGQKDCEGWTWWIPLWWDIVSSFTFINSIIIYILMLPYIGVHINIANQF